MVEFCGCGVMVATRHLGCRAERRGGSNPLIRTNCAPWEFDSLSGHRITLKDSMEIKRRDFIQASIVGLGSLGISGCSQNASTHSHHQVGNVIFDPTKEPKRIRKSFYELSDEELRNLCKAIGYMRNEFPLEHPLQWDNYAKIHALHCTEPNVNHPPVHWSWNFLPWHRGYLYFLERILANILTTKFSIDGTKFALPYWNWSKYQEIPNTRLRNAIGLSSPLFGYDLFQENMVNADDLGFDNSALCEGNRGPTLTRYQMDPKNELTQDSKDHVIEAMHYFSDSYVSFMLSAPFEQFAGKPVTNRQTGQGLLEQGPHNDGHDWVGSRIGKNRSMGTLRSAAGDPMFYLHHANIDRIWSLYDKPQPDPKGDWGKQSYNFLDIDGSIVTLSVQDIIEKTTNVSYDNDTVPAKRVGLKLVNIPTLFSVNKDIESTPITISMPTDFSGRGAMLLDVTTGPIPYTEKYTIKVFADGKFVGKLKWLDGEYRKIYTDPEIKHTFSLLLTTLPVKVDKLTFVPPKRGAVKIFIRSLEYKPL